MSPGAWGAREVLGGVGFLTVVLSSAAWAASGQPIPGSDAPTISSSPLVSIGLVDGNGPQVWTEIVGALRLDDGRLVASDGMTREVRYFSPEGESQAVVGGFGEGPGEFRTMYTPMRCAPEELALWDPALSRVSLFDGSGEYLGQATVSDFTGTVGVRPWRMACNDQGLLAVASRPLPGRPPGVEGPLKEAIFLTLRERGSESTVDLGAVAEVEFYFSAGSLVPRPLGASMLVAMGSGTVYVATTTETRVRRFLPDGTELDPFRWTPDDFPTHDRDRAIELWIDERVADAGNPTQARQFFQDLEFPERLPFIAGLLVDSTGILWVQEFHPDPAKPQIWRVHTLQGDLLGRVEAPPGLRLLQVDAAYAVGVRTDALGVEYLQVHAVER